MQTFKTSSNFEKIIAEKITQTAKQFNTEKIKTLISPDFKTLGKITALRFIEWAQQNPGGTVSLPTGKSPKTFIEWVQYYLENWQSKEVANELESFGINSTIKPDILGLRFIQMDEYFSINSNDAKSFLNYIKTNYFAKLGFSENNALIIDLNKICPEHANIESIFPDGKVDLSLRKRKPQTNLEQQQLDLILRTDEFAANYEEQIKKLGGIGFFLGGIGPDGHIAFNFKWSMHNSTTRLIKINYETAAACAAGFGGIENIRHKAVITIGLETITQNPTTTAIIIADGLSKAKICKRSIETDESINYPATALQRLDHSSFYLTQAAASELTNQKYFEYKQTPEQINVWGTGILIDIANKEDKSLQSLSLADIKKHELGSLLAQDDKKLKEFIKLAESEIKQKIENCLKDLSGKTFLHTSPHHDDVLLGYFPLVQHLVKNKTDNYFATMTSGSNSVTNEYLLEYLAKSGADKTQIEQIKNLIDTEPKSAQILDLKGKIRDQEEELVWKNLGIDSSHVISMKLGFYQDKTGQIDFTRDVEPVINLLNKIKPDVVTVASEPEGAGHDTHTKVYKIVMEAVKHYRNQNPGQPLQVWGYRNVWCQIDPAQADLCYPINSNDFDMLKQIFNTCYLSQINAWLPSPEYDGPFCDFAEKIMARQYEIIKTCLGNDYFDKHENNKVHNARGFCFIKFV